MVPTANSRMEWTPRIGIEGQSRTFEAMAISRRDGLDDSANLGDRAREGGLTLVEAKPFLVYVHQQVVAPQTRRHAMFRPDCQSCGGRCHVKDGWPLRVCAVERRRVRSDG